MEEAKTVAMTDTVPKTFWHGVQTRAAKTLCRLPICAEPNRIVATEIAYTATGNTLALSGGIEAGVYLYTRR